MRRRQRPRRRIRGIERAIRFGERRAETSLPRTVLRRGGPSALKSKGAAPGVGGAGGEYGELILPCGILERVVSPLRGLRGFAACTQGSRPGLDCVAPSGLDSGADAPFLFGPVTWELKLPPPKENDAASAAKAALI